ncbi:MAG: M24 family metallopeptidase [Candidatus Hodarchaeales archaeon]|jgi:methionine aminopeptidase
MTPIKKFLIFCLILIISLVSVNINFGKSNESNILPHQKFKINEELMKYNQKASELSSIALTEAKHFLRQTYDNNLTQKELVNHLEEIMWAEGADPDLSFSTLVYSGNDNKYIHADPMDDKNHIISPDTEPVLTIDLGAKYQGQCSDVTRTYFFDGATQEMLEAYQMVLKAEKAIINAIKAGVAISDVDYIFRSYLVNYILDDDIYVHLNWGHGVGEFVHEYPTLNNWSEDALFLGQVLAIEPNIINFKEKWHIRVEDTVVVTTDGVEILSNAPKELNDITIFSNETSMIGQITTGNYSYGEETIVYADFKENEQIIQNVTYYDGYNWFLMEKINESSYKFSYHLNYSYSGLIRGIIKANLENETLYFSKELKSEPNQTNIDENYIWLIDSYASGLLEWEINVSEASMLRVHFLYMNAPKWDQLVVIDENGKIIFNYEFNGNQTEIWSPWISGSKIVLKYFISDQVGVSYFEFAINKVEFFTIPEEPIISSTEATSNTLTSSITTTSSQSIQTSSEGTDSAGYDIKSFLILFFVSITYLGFKRKKKLFF